MKKIITKKNIFLFVVLLIIGGLVATTGYFYNEYQKVKKNPDLIAKEETKSVTDSIKRFMELPSDEEPTLATITDKEKLKDQEFFKNAQNGDKVLIYTKAKKAILYRPSTGRVIEFAPLILGPTEGTTESSQSNQTQPISVAIYNGTQTPGLTAEYEKKLSGIEGLSVVSKANAAKSDYTETIVVDITGTNSEMVRNIAKTVGGAVKSLPDGETKPQADVLVIASQK
jgi:hypothetical protein